MKQTGLLIMLLFFCSQAVAGNKDQEINIVSVAGCITELTPVDDNCKQDDGKRGECEDKKNCVCAKPDKHIIWKSADKLQYTVYFYDAKIPFKSNCSLDADRKGTLKCKIKGDASGSYDYGVKVAGCPDFDPRIIVK